MGLKRIIPTLGFFLLILVSFALKLIEFDNPFSGFHLFRQLDNLVAMESYFIEGIELKRRVTNGGRILYELPIYQALVAFLAFSMDELLFYSRAVNLVFAFLSIILVFRIANIWFGFKTAIYSTLFFAFAPLNLAYQRAVMMDIGAIFFCLAATWLLLEYFKGRYKTFSLAFFVVAGGLSVVTKPLYFFPVGAIALANYISQYYPPFPTNTINYIKKNLGLVFSFIFIAVLLLWWLRIVDSINGSEQGLVSTFMSDWSFLFSSKFYALLMFRFTLLIFNPFTLVLFFIGVVLIWKRHRGNDSIALPILIPTYFVIFGGINFPHEYYALIMIPYCSLVAGIGATWLEDILCSNNLINNREITFGIFSIVSSIASVLIFFMNFLVGSPNLEQKPVQIAQEMRPILQPRQFSYVYINKPNFPLFDYIKYNRSLYLSYALTIRSKDDIKIYGKPITGKEILYALRQYGATEFTQDDIPNFEQEKLQRTYQRSLKYVMFYRYFENQKIQIKNLMTEYKIFYESDDWVVYDLGINSKE